MLTFGKTKPTTVDGVLSAFKETISSLYVVAGTHKEEADFQSGVVAQALVRKEAAEAEAERAVKIAVQMEAVFGK